MKKPSPKVNLEKEEILCSTVFRRTRSTCGSARRSSWTRLRGSSATRNRGRSWEDRYDRGIELIHVFNWRRGRGWRPSPEDAAVRGKPRTAPVKRLPTPCRAPAGAAAALSEEAKTFFKQQQDAGRRCEAVLACKFKTPRDSPAHLEVDTTRLRVGRWFGPASLHRRPRCRSRRSEGRAHRCVG